MGDRSYLLTLIRLIVEVKFGDHLLGHSTAKLIKPGSKLPGGSMVESAFHPFKADMST